MKLFLFFFVFFWNWNITNWLKLWLSVAHLRVAIMFFFFSMLNLTFCSKGKKIVEQFTSWGTKAFSFATCPFSCLYGSIHNWDFLAIHGMKRTQCAEGNSNHNTKHHFLQYVNPKVNPKNQNLYRAGQVNDHFSCCDTVPKYSHKEFTWNWFGGL